MVDSFKMQKKKKNAKREREKDTFENKTAHGIT